MVVATGPPAHHDNELSVGALLDIADGFGQCCAGRLIEFFAAHHLKNGKSNTSHRDTETQRKGPLELNAKRYAAFCMTAVSLWRKRFQTCKRPSRFTGPLPHRTHQGDFPVHETVN